MNNTKFDQFNIKYHPACELFPTLPDHELQALADDIKENGLLEPIVVINDEILDGRNRFEACEVAGVEPSFVNWEGKGSPTEWVVAKNLHRRHLSASQRAAIACELLPRLQEEAKERQRLSKGQGVKGKKYCPTEMGKASEIVAGMFGVSSTLVEQVNRAKKNAPELVKEVINGTITAKHAADLSEVAEATRKEVVEKARKPKAKVARLVRQALSNHQMEQRRIAGNKITLIPSDDTSTLCLDSDLPEVSSESKKSPPLKIAADPAPRINTMEVGDCRDLIPHLPDGSINLGLTSPPYAEQRKAMYPSVPESEYAAFTVEWMSKLWDKLSDDGSVLLIIRPHLKSGVISDYVLRTRLALREFGWKECEELIWHKPDGGSGTGSNHRPKRAFEHILWFSKTNKPFIDTKACGEWSDRIGFVGADRFGTGSHRRLHSGLSKKLKTGRSRASDVFHVAISKNEKGVMHPAMFPISLAERLIETFCPNDGTVLDPFAGSGTTLIAAKNLDRKYYGFDLVPEYVEIARNRLDTLQADPVNNQPERDFDYYRGELRAILEDCINFGSDFPKEHVHEMFAIFRGSEAIDFEVAINSMPTPLREYYESLPSKKAG